MSEVLTKRDVYALGKLVDWAQRGARVEYLSERNEVRTGVVRNFVNEQRNFLSEQDDVRDAFLWITTEGWEWFPTVREVVEMLRATTIVEMT